LPTSSDESETTNAPNEIPQIKIGPTEHPTQHTWSFWYVRRVQGSRSQENYEKNVKKVGSFASVSFVSIICTTFLLKIKDFVR
jgi:hypothetical protein